MVGFPKPDKSHAAINNKYFLVSISRIPFPKNNFLLNWIMQELTKFSVDISAVENNPSSSSLLCTKVEKIYHGAFLSKHVYAWQISLAFNLKVVIEIGGSIEDRTLCLTTILHLGQGTVIFWLVCLCLRAFYPVNSHFLDSIVIVIARFPFYCLPYLPSNQHPSPQWDLSCQKLRILEVSWLKFPVSIPAIEVALPMDHNNWHHLARLPILWMVFGKVQSASASIIPFLCMFSYIKPPFGWYIPSLAILKPLRSGLILLAVVLGCLVKVTPQILVLSHYVLIVELMLGCSLTLLDLCSWGCLHCSPPDQKVLNNTVYQVLYLLSTSNLEKEIATHSRFFAWKIPWTEEPGRLQSMGSQRAEHDWANK